MTMERASDERFSFQKGEIVDIDKIESSHL